MKQFNNFYEGAYAKYILPGVLLQSVLIGGGYATDFGSVSNLLLGLITLATCLLWNMFAKGSPD